VVPFNISCGTCFMCTDGLQSQCETTQVRERGTGAALFGYTKLYGQVPGGQAEFPAGAVREHVADQGAARPEGSTFPVPVRCAASGVAGAGVCDVPDGGSLVVLGLGPIGDMAPGSPANRAYRGDRRGLVPERLQRARRHGVTTIDLNDHGGDLAEVIRDRTGA